MQPETPPGPAGPPPQPKTSSGRGWILAIVGGCGCLALIGALVAGVLVFAVVKRQQEEARLERELERWDRGGGYGGYGGRGRDPYGGRGGDPFGRNAPSRRGNDPLAGRANDPLGRGGGLGTAGQDVRTVHRVPVGDSPQLGPDDALVTIVVFSDFQCPFCKRSTDTMDRVRETYGSDVRLVFKHRPLPFHTRAGPAAHAAIEAYEDGGDEAFWKMHDLLFENQSALDDRDLVRYARQVGASGARVRRAVQRGAHQDVLDRDEKLAHEVGANGTPTFFINGVELRGAQPLSSFRVRIDDELGRARSMVQKGTPRADVYDEIMKDAS